MVSGGGSAGTLTHCHSPVVCGRGQAACGRGELWHFVLAACQQAVDTVLGPLLVTGVADRALVV